MIGGGTRLTGKFLSMAEYRVPTWEEDRDALATFLAERLRNSRKAGFFRPGDVDPEEYAIRMFLNYLSSSVETDTGGLYSPSVEQVRRVLRLPHQPPRPTWTEPPQEA